MNELRVPVAVKCDHTHDARQVAGGSPITIPVKNFHEVLQDESVVLLGEAQKKGLLTTKDEYRSLYVSYINADRDKDAVKVIEDGVAKGIIQPSPELAKDYMVLGQKAFYNEDDATAIEMYKRAMPMAGDGEAALNLAKLYAAAGKNAEARAAAQQALEKGVKDTAGAKKLAGGK